MKGRPLGLTEEKRRLFETMPPARAAAVMAAPTVLSSLVMVAYSLADTYFVGRLNDPVQTAAVALAAPVLLAFNAATNLLGIGASSVMGRALGKGDYETVQSGSAMAFWGSLLCGGLFSVLFTFSGDAGLRLLGADGETLAAMGAYIRWTVRLGAVPAILSGVMAYLVRVEGKSLSASIGSMSGCLLNILLDPLFILRLGMGAEGAGLATCLSNCVSCAYFLALLAHRPGCLTARPSAVRWGTMGEICGVGVPAAVQNLLNVVGMTVLNQFTAAYGPDAVAAMGIVQKINLVPFYIAVGGAQGVMPLISYSYAQKNVKRMKSVTWISMGAAVCFMTLTAAGYGLWAPQLTGAFMKTPSIIAYGTVFLRELCLVLPFFGTDFFAVGVFQACNMGRTALMFAVARKVVLEIPLLCLLNWTFPLYGLPFAQVITEAVLSLWAVWTVISLFRRLS